MVSQRIAQYLKDNGIVQRHLCDKTGISSSAMSAALNGKRKLSIDEYIGICSALGVPSDTFFETVGTKTA